MDRKKLVSILAFVMAVIMILSLFLSVLPAAFAIEQEEIDELEQKKEELAAHAEEAKQRVDGLKEQEASVLEQKVALEEEMKAREASLEILDQQLAVYELAIAEKAIEVQQARTVEDEQLRRYRARVRAMEEDGGFNILILIAQSSSLGELLSALDDAGDVMASDKALERQYRSAREESERVMGEFEELRDACEEKQKKLNEEKDEIAKDIQEAESKLSDLEEDIQVATVQYEAARDAEAAAAQEILAFIAAYQEQKAREEEEARAREEENYDNNGEGDLGWIDIPTPVPTEAPAPETPQDPQPQEPENPQPQDPAEPDPGSEGGEQPGEGGEGETPEPTPAPTPAPTPVPTPPPPSSPATGSFVWPVPCSMRITSRFGNRIDPFTGQVRYHSGIDIDGYNHEGYPIIAADGGTVVTATYNDGYGNYVIIDHGNGYMTLYGHMSGHAVSYGDVVSQGQTIGYLGATGRATGTHCHFEVFLDGNRIDPEQFFSGMSYWGC